jgi:hypothetical protein
MARFAPIVGGIEPGTIKEHEEVEPLMEQMLGKSEIGGIATGVGQQPIQLYFQPSGRSE